MQGQPPVLMAIALPARWSRGPRPPRCRHAALPPAWPEGRWLAARL